MVLFQHSSLEAVRAAEGQRRAGLVFGGVEFAMRISRFLPLLVVLSAALRLKAQNAALERVLDSPAPAAWSSSQAREVLEAQSATDPLPFVGVTPCRVADTRGNGFTGDYGPPSLSPGGQRVFPLVGLCGIPAAAEAVSLNITVTDGAGPGF